MMRYVLLLTVALAACESQAFDSDRRQLAAKDEIRRLLHQPPGFDVIAFRQDTLSTFSDTTFKHPLQYSLRVVYTDPTGGLQKRQGRVLFTPDGRSVIQATIDDQIDQ